MAPGAAGGENTVAIMETEPEQPFVIKPGEPEAAVKVKEAAPVVEGVKLMVTGTPGVISPD